ncbi:hypothetical protein GH714_003712 [Hevea brasiliensis]|uniref:Bet v I/Major latex protein domain-containing protein n=1 Tax=Hevea brasiliensis TaxID=3981 RepID=A0A6A6LXT9_HEVBR|nr:hypothetical protein GH714_003712 [Hevea brasiliensis]
MISKYYAPILSPNQCGSSLIQTIDAPLPLVWSIIRQFDNPQAYKQFVKSCEILSGNGRGIGSVRELKIISGLAAKRSAERLDNLDDESYVMMVSIIGGDHKLENYKSTISLHEIAGDEEKGRKTAVIESSLATVTEKMASAR